jgi:hypothetical protein
MPFISTFVNEVLDTHDPHTTHKNDINFSNIIPHLAPMFMNMLVRVYGHYLNYNLKEPNEIKKHINTLKECPMIYLANSYRHVLVRIQWAYML